MREGSRKLKKPSKVAQPARPVESPKLRTITLVILAVLDFVILVLVDLDQMDFKNTTISLRNTKYHAHCALIKLRFYQPLPTTPWTNINMVKTTSIAL